MLLAADLSSSTSLKCDNTPQVQNIFTARRAELKINNSPAGKPGLDSDSFIQENTIFSKLPCHFNLYDKAPLYSFWENLVKNYNSAIAG